MMREGEAALVPEAVTALKRGDNRLIKQFAEDLEERRWRPARDRTPSSSAACTTPSNAARPGPASTRRRATQAIQAGGVYGLNAQLSKLPAFCPVWRVPVAPPAERQPVKVADPDPAAERRLRLADAARLGPRGGAAPAGVAPCHLPRPGPWRVEPGPVRGPPARRVHRRARSARAPCRADTPLNFTAAYERARPDDFSPTRLARCPQVEGHAFAARHLPARAERQ